MAVTANALNLVGLALKAGRLEIGEEPVGDICRAKRAKVVLLASDAAENTAHKAERFAQTGNAPLAVIPFTKAELGRAVGRASCAMAAMTDAGMAHSFLSKLAQADPERYGETANTLNDAAQRVAHRRKEQKAHERNVQHRKAKPWAPKPKGQDSSKK